MAASTLLRVAHLARFWEKNERTVLGWIRQGRLAAIRSPGGHYRIRVADVKAFCEREGWPVPPAASAGTPRVVVSLDVVPRTFKVAGADVDARANPYDALLAVAARGAAVVVLPATSDGFDVERAIAALRGTLEGRAPAVVVVGAAGRARMHRLQHAGAASVLPKARAGQLADVVRALLDGA